MYISGGGRPIESGYQPGFHRQDPAAPHVLSRRLPRPVRRALAVAVLAAAVLVLVLLAT